jgi:hypothetical protein
MMGVVFSVKNVDAFIFYFFVVFVFSTKGANNEIIDDFDDREQTCTNEETDSSTN